MKRRALKLLLFLLLGAIINVAVAWGLTFRRQSLQRFVQLGPSSSMDVIDWHEEPYTSEPWIEANRLTQHRIHTRNTVACAGLQIAQYEGSVLLFSNSSPFSTTIAERVSAGWPAMAVSGGRWRIHQWNATKQSEQFVAAIAIQAFTPKMNGLQRVLPIRPIWPGFAINTIFYAAIAWMMFALPGAIRRRRRIKRGVCARCAYPVGVSENCTECGGAVSPRRSES